jgi:hypothetical protein
LWEPFVPAVNRFSKLTACPQLRGTGRTGTAATLDIIRQDTVSGQPSPGAHRMSTEQQAPVWGTAEPSSAVPLGAPAPLGAPEPPKKMSKTKTIVAAAVAGVVVVGGGVAVVSAVNSSSSGTNQTGGPGGNGGFPGGRNGFGGGFGAAGLSDALYGDFVASDGIGG